MKPSSQDTEKSLRFFAVLLAISNVAHLSIHLPMISFSTEWISGALVLLAAGWVIAAPQVKSLLVLAMIQCVNVILLAPFNPDHWLLVFFINLVLIVSAFCVWVREGTVSPQKLMQRTAPAARLVFLICYGFAAFSKLNSDFLFSENSAARELFQIQLGAMPILNWLVWPPMVPWVTIVCESTIPLLLLFKRTRVLGILIGIGFHTALIISPAVKVFDFTLTIVAMLYLFTPGNFESNIKTGIQDFKNRIPAIFGLFERYKWLLVGAPIGAVLAISCWHPMPDLPPRLVRLTASAGLFTVVLLGGIFLAGMIGNLMRHDGFRWTPRGAFGWLVIGLAIVNGLCPYLGLKTQGSFTMFSNVRTEAGNWNHLVMPQSMQVFSDYQNKLVKIVGSDNESINQYYVASGNLITEFELQRIVLTNPEIELTIEKDGNPIEINEPENRLALGPPPGLLARKLLIFRAVSPDERILLTN